MSLEKDIYLQKRPFPGSYPRDVLRELRLIAIDKEGMAEPFGSYTYRFQRYPGDVDGMEIIGTCCSEKEAAEEYVKAIKRIVRNITSKRSHYYSEIKAGINPLFDFPVGDLTLGVFTQNPHLSKIIPEYYQKGWLSDEELLILTAVDNNALMVSNSDMYDVVEYIFRKHRVLRWSAKEILEGKKKLEDGSFLSLFDAIQMNTMTKIDEVALVEGRFVEITNNWHLEWVDHTGNYHTFNEDEGQPTDLVDEIEKLYFSNMFYSPFKMVKRIYAYSRYMYFQTRQQKWIAYMKKVIPLLQDTNISASYQIKSELDTLVLILQLYRHPSPVTISKQLEYTKQRIASILFFTQQDLSEINTDIDGAIASPNNGMKIDQIEKVISKLKGLINYETIKYLQGVGLNPPPRDLLPIERRYGNLTRTPLSNPKNPYKKYKDYVSSLGRGAGCETCGGILKYDECIECKDSAQVRLANIINRIY